MANALVSEYFILDLPPGFTPFDDAVLKEFGAVTLHRAGRLEGAKFNPRADVWAIRCMGRCLSRDGKWHMEPLPSSRTKSWLKAHRFTLAKACELLDITLANGPV